MINNNERGERPSFATCGICDGYPIGIGCYHICPNSIHFYTPEQERYDEANYDPSEYYREGGFGDPEQYHDEGEDEYRRNPDGTVTLITPSGGEHTYLPDDLDSHKAADAIEAEIQAGMTITHTDNDDIPF